MHRFGFQGQCWVLIWSRMSFVIASNRSAELQAVWARSRAGPAGSSASSRRSTCNARPSSYIVMSGDVDFARMIAARRCRDMAGHLLQARQNPPPCERPRQKRHAKRQRYQSRLRAGPCPRGPRGEIVQPCPGQSEGRPDPLPCLHQRRRSFHAGQLRRDEADFLGCGSRFDVALEAKEIDIGEPAQICPQVGAAFAEHVGDGCADLHPCVAGLSGDDLAQFRHPRRAALHGAVRRLPGLEPLARGVGQFGDRLRHPCKQCGLGDARTFGVERAHLPDVTIQPGKRDPQLLAVIDTVAAQVPVLAL